jgi:hypothetical protein
MFCGLDIFSSLIFNNYLDALFINNAIISLLSS